MTLLEAIAKARENVAAVTALPIDAVSKCERDGDGWRVKVDVIESRARIGDDDLLATFQIGLDGGGEVTGYERIARYKRSQSAQRGV